MKDNNDISKEVQILDIKKDVKYKPLYDFYFGITLLGRIIFTLYSFHGLFFIYNIIIQYIISIPSVIYSDNLSTFQKILFSIFYLIFAMNSSNVLVIPSFECLTFPFLIYKNPKCHLISFAYIYLEKEFNEKKIENKNCWVTNIFFIFVEISYLIGIVMGYTSNKSKYKDYTKMVILIFLYFYYFTLLLCYFFVSLYLTIMIIKNSKYGLNFRKNINYYFKNKPDLPDVNLLSYLLNPFILKYYYDEKGVPLKDNKNFYFEDFIYFIKYIIKFFMFIFSFICFIYIFFNYINNWYYHFLYLIIFFIMTVLSLTLNFPFCYRNRKTFGIFGCCCNFFKFQKRNNIISTNIIYNYKFFHPFIVSITRFIWDIIIFLLSLVILTLFFIQIGNTDNNIDFSSVIPQEIKDNKGLLLPNICFSSIHKIPILLFLPFINDAYYYNNKNKFSSLNNEIYKSLFFNKDYNIKVMGNLIEEEKTVKMIQYNVKINDNYNANYVTILSIKGTSYNKDMLLDIQLYFSSILLNLLNSFSVMTQKDSLSFQLIEYSLNIPYRIFFKYLMIDDYLQKLKKAYDLNKYTFYSKVVIVGHSLGGGLAKLFGRIIGKQAISLSGPGINAFHSLWDYKGSSENFGISAIDLVPDKDLVPRVEISGGTVYRILCIEGVLDCHSKEMSLCEVLIMCRNPNYKTYCTNIAKYSENDIKKLYDISELNPTEEKN